MRLLMRLTFLGLSAKTENKSPKQTVFLFQCYCYFLLLRPCRGTFRPRPDDLYSMLQRNISQVPQLIMTWTMVVSLFSLSHFSTDQCHGSIIHPETRPVRCFGFLPGRPHRSPCTDHRSVSHPRPDSTGRRPRSHLHSGYRPLRRCASLPACKLAVHRV